MKKIACITALMCLGLAACSTPSPTGTSQASMNSEGGSNTSASNAGGESTEPSDPAATASSDAGLKPLGEASIERKIRQPQTSESLVRSVRVGHHDGFDRIVFELVGAEQPGWSIDYSENPTAQGSGHSLDYEGKVALMVNIDGMAYPFQLGMEDFVLESVKGAGKITGVQSVGMFEGRSQFLVGLNAKHPYSVQLLQQPTRVVVDILDAPA